MFVLSARQTVNWCTDNLIIGIKLSYLKCFRQILQKGEGLKIILSPRCSFFFCLE